MNNGFYNGAGQMQPFQAVGGVRTVTKISTDLKGNVVNFEEGPAQEIYAAAAINLSASKVPLGEISAVIVRLWNAGVAGLTSTNIIWLKPDNTQTTSFAALGVTLQTAGSNLVMLLSFGDGLVYGKVS